MFLSTVHCDISHLDTNYIFMSGYDGSIYESNNLLSTYTTALDTSIDPLNTGRASRCGGNLSIGNTPLLLHETKVAFFTSDSVSFLANSSFNSGDIVTVSSKAGNVPFQYILNTSLQQGDSIKVPDPVKSNLFLLSPCGIWMKKHAINQSTTPDWFQISPFGNLTCITVTGNGNKVFAGYQNGTVLSITGLNMGHYNNYNMTDSFQYVVDTFMATMRSITSIYVDPNNDNHILLTSGRYIADTVPNAYKSTNGGLTWTRVLIGPIGTTALSCLIDVNNSNNYVVGTDQGIWTSNDAGATWHQDDANMCNVSVSQVRQIPLYNDSCYVIYASTNSKGLWRSVTLTQPGCTTTLVTCDSTLGILSPANKPNDFTLYPNPATSNTTVQFTITESQRVTIQLHDITGRLVQTWQQFLSGNNQKVELNTSSLHAGTYLVSIETGQALQTKLLVIEE